MIKNIIQGLGIILVTLFFIVGTFFFSGLFVYFSLFVEALIPAGAACGMVIVFMFSFAQFIDRLV